MNRPVGFDDKTAREIVASALQKRGTPEQQANGPGRRIAHEDFMSLEVIKAIPAARKTVGEMAEPTLLENKYIYRMQALGKL